MQNHRLKSLPNPCGSNPRAGLTLYEIVLAFTVFLMSMAAISQLLTLGSRAATQSQLRTEAALLAESKMAEIVGGAQSLSGSDNNLFSEDDPSWMWALAVNDVSLVSAPGLKEVIVTVTHANTAGAVNATFSIKRYLRDPSIFLEAANEAASQAAESSSSGSSSSMGGM